LPYIGKTDIYSNR